MPDTAAIEADQYEGGIKAEPEVIQPPAEPVQPELPQPPAEEPEPESVEPKPEAPEDDKGEAGQEQAARKNRLEERKQGIQAQINELVRERGEVSRETERGRAERAELQRDIEALKAEQARIKGGGQPRPNGAAQPHPSTGLDPNDPEPVEAQFPDYATYTKAAGAWAARTEWRKQSFQQWVSNQEAQQRQKFSNNYQTFAKANPTFEQEINRKDLVLTDPMVRVIKGSDIGPQMMLYLARNSDEVDRIGSLPMLDAFGEMKKLEARLEGAHSGPPQPAAQHSKAPAPIKPVGNAMSRQSDSSDIPDESVSDDEHFERMNKRDEALRKRGINPRRGYGARI